MRKRGVLFAILSIAIICLVIANSANAQDVGKYRKQIGNKAARGVGNVMFGWTEIPKRVVDITQESKNPIWGAVAGVYQGTLKALARTTSGVVDIATCGIRSDEKPFVQPDMDVE